VHLDNVPNDCETQAEATMFPSRGTVRLTEAIEDVRKEFRRDSDAVIRDGNARMVLALFQSDGDRTTIPSEFHSVGQ